jgi:integrase
MPRHHREIPWLDTEDNGYYYVYWYDKAAKRTQRKSLDTKSPVDAQKRYAAFLSEGHEIYTEDAGITVSQALDFYHKEHVLQKVVDVARSQRCCAVLKKHFGNTPLKDVDIAACNAYTEARKSGKLIHDYDIDGKVRRRGPKPHPVTDSTCRRELAVLVSATTHNFKHKRIKREHLPIFEMPPETPVDPVGEDDWLTVPELLRALNAIRPFVMTSIKPETVAQKEERAQRLYDFIVLAYDSASRRNAIEEMTVSQVNLRNGTVNLRNPGETANQRRSKKRRPIVPIDKPADKHPLLQAGHSARKVYERRLAEVRELVVTGEMLTPWVLGDNKDMYFPFRNLMESIGLGHKRNPHILRHSRATHLLMAGESIYDVAKLLGDTIETVEKIYGHYSPEFLFERRKA